jgi:hypothetical protein
VINRALSPSEGERFASAREMGRQLSLVLRSARAPKDLHELLGRSVIEARAELKLGQRTGETSSTTPLADWDPEEMAAQVSRAESESDSQRSRPKTEPPMQTVKRGVLHRIPFFRKKS